METDITISYRTCGLLKGRTVESESGIAAMLTIEVPLGAIVELGFMLPDGPVTHCATLRQKNAFRYRFEVVDPYSERNHSPHMPGSYRWPKSVAGFTT